jgi:hypothetical protein
MTSEECIGAHGNACRRAHAEGAERYEGLGPGDAS